jgi:DNA primase
VVGLQALTSCSHFIYFMYFSDGPLVESPLTVVAKTHLIEDGYRFISTLGAGVSATQLDLLSEFPELTIWFDNDLAGWEHTKQVSDYLSRSTNVFVANSPHAADVDELDDDTVTDLLEEYVPYEEWHPPETLLAAESR